LPLGVVHAAHPQDLSSVAVLQPQKVIHDSSSLLAYALRKQLPTILAVGPPAGGKPFAEVIWQLVSPGLLRILPLSVSAVTGVCTKPLRGSVIP
jgi:hypothetical protein